MTDSETKSLISQKKKIDKVEKTAQKTKKSKENELVNEEEAKRETLERQEAERLKQERKQAKSKIKDGDQVVSRQEGSRGNVKKEEDTRAEDDQTEIKEWKKSKQIKKSRRKSDTVAQGTQSILRLFSTDTTTIQREKRSKKTIEIPPEWVPIRHPKLPDPTPPHYFVRKDMSGVYKSYRGKIKPMVPLHPERPLRPRYKLTYGTWGHVILKLEEIMAYTFSDHFDCTKHYIIHKDAQLDNCAWSNLVICDLLTLQEHEIARLQKLHPDKKYTVVRNVHATLTFEHYLVSDTGEIYSLIERTHGQFSKFDDRQYVQRRLYPDNDVKQPSGKNNGIVLHIRNIVKHSFNGAQETKYDAYHSSSYCGNRATATTSTNKKKHAPVGKQNNKAITPPPITDNTEWKVIGVLPWDGSSFSQYEVSNMGHVRRKDTCEMLPLVPAKFGHLTVSMCKDGQERMGAGNNRSVARLVANAFVDGYNSKLDTVKHLNKDNQDNRALNLKWVTNLAVNRPKRSVRPVVASLVDDPKVQEVFQSIYRAELELGVDNLRKKLLQYGTLTKEVDWDGEKELVHIQFHLSEEQKQ
ncbi:hypothetical protein BJV82DRAFT_655890 [Fennellomyces sp. T-0311]|nr:hypothetical protein BJV82DRAFT_655890 [Fennellomyces sp. T-0311]